MTVGDLHDLNASRALGTFLEWRSEWASPVAQIQEAAAQQAGRIVAVLGEGLFQEAPGVAVGEVRKKIGRPGGFLTEKSQELWVTRSIGKVR